MKLTYLKQKVSPILRHHGVVEAYLFGSAARGKTSKKSDIDILARFGKAHGLFEHIRTKRDLEESLDRKVDLVEMGALRREMRSSVDAEKIRIL